MNSFMISILCLLATISSAQAQFYPEPVTPEQQASFDEAFATTKPIHDQGLEVAASLAVVPFTINLETEYTFCRDELKAAIRKNYSIDPFDPVTSSGGAHATLCSGMPNTKFYFQEISGKTTFGLSYRYVFQQKYPAQYEETGWNDITITLFLDSNYKMLEETTIQVKKSNSKVVFTSISTFNDAGDFFNRAETDIGIEPVPGYSGPYSTYRYVKADGSMAEPIYKRIYRKADDHSQTVSNVMYSINVDDSWNDLVIPLTFGWSGGFYYYADRDQFRSGSLSTKQKVIVYRNDEELCYSGSDIVYEYQNNGSLLLKFQAYPSYDESLRCSGFR